MDNFVLAKLILTYSIILINQLKAHCDDGSYHNEMDAYSNGVDFDYSKSIFETVNIIINKIETP